MKFCADHKQGSDLDQAFAALSLSDPVAGAASRAFASEPSPERAVGNAGNATTRMRSASQPLPTSGRELSIILMAMRKLREALVATSRVDTFAQRTYVFTIRAALLVKHMESYHPALLHLLHRIHPICPLPGPEYHEFVGYFILDLACRLRDFHTSFTVRLKHGYKDRRVDMVLNALVHDNWVLFWRMRKVVDGYQKRLMEWAEDELRVQALKCLGKTYMTVDLPFLESTTRRTWEELQRDNRVGWELEDAKVTIRKPKAR